MPNLVPAQRGRFQTRINRVVDIEGSREVQVDLGAGRKTTKTVWFGTMFEADCKTPSGRYEWESSGMAVNPRGVATPNDLAQLIRAAAPEPAPEPESAPVPTQDPEGRDDRSQALTSDQPGEAGAPPETE